MTTNNKNVNDVAKNKDTVTLLHTNDNEKLNAIFKGLKEDEIIFNPDGVKVGRIERIIVNDKKNRDGQAYQQIQLEVRGTDGKLLVKRYSVDFTRKVFNQLGVTSKEVSGSAVIFKPSGRFNQIGWLSFIVEEEEDGKTFYDIKFYEDDGEDFSSALEKLGL